MYRLQFHEAKLAILLDAPIHRRFAGVRDYRARIAKDFPHDLFQAAGHRSSTFPAALHAPIVRKENQAMRMAALVLPTSPSNKQRHETLQRFMLINDSVTMAVEWGGPLG